VLGLDLPIGPLTLGGLYRYESGAPFTPGFRPGVDANGDGGDDNDPVFVDDAIPGVTDVFAEWDCLSTQVGAFAARNSCREPGSHRLDLRLTVTPPASDPLGAHHSTGPAFGERRRTARSRSAGRSHGTVRRIQDGVTTVPLIANPAFKNVLARRTLASCYGPYGRSGS
jgi:hypothetical protein